MDLLQSQTCPTVLEVLSFSLNEKAYRDDRRRPVRATLDRLLSDVSISQIDLGLFAFPPTDHELNDVTAEPETVDRMCMN
jgi:hypothetical protein